MAMIRNIGNAWSASVTLTAGEIWQCRSGTVYVATGSGTPDEDDGIILPTVNGIEFASGTILRYRSGGGAGGSITRQVVG